MKKYKPLTKEQNQKKWQRRLKVLTENPHLYDKIRTNNKKFRASPKGRAAHLINAARKRSRVSGIEVSLPAAYVEWALIVGVCMRTGVKFDFGTYGNRAAFAPSLDRKDPSKGYTLENTEVVCNAFNMAKNEWDYSTLATWVEAMRDQVWYQKLIHQR